MQELDDLLGCKVVIALAQLIPRGLSDYYEYKVFGRTLCKFLRTYNEAINIAIEVYFIVIYIGNSENC